MSMRDQDEEQNLVESHSKVDLSVGREVVCMSAHLSPQDSSAPAPLDAARCNSSPLLRIFASKNVVPKVLEYEKAILVMKEHDYAKKQDRAEVQQLSGLVQELSDAPQEQSSVSEEASDPVSVIMNLRKEIHEFRNSLVRSEDGLITSQLRDLVSMHIELIREQQEQLHDKDKELSTVRKDKEQLEARLERMERRLAISQKRLPSRYENSEVMYAPSQHNLNAGEGIDLSAPLVATHRPHFQADIFAVASSEHQSRSRSSSNDPLGASGGTSRSRRRVQSNSGTPVPQEEPVESYTPPVHPSQLATPLASSSLNTPTPAKRSSKRKVINESTPNSIKSESASKKKKSKQTELRTKVEYLGLNLPMQRRSHRTKSLDFSTQTSVSSDVGSKLGGTQGEGIAGVMEGDALGSQSTSSCSASSVQGSEGGQNGVGEDMIIVPSWKTVACRVEEEAGPGEENSAVTEDLSDEAFLKRHRKPEEDEKRRKRWDMQRARSLWNYEELKKKYEQKSGDKPEKKKERLVTFIPKLSEVDTIELRETVTVSAFGMPLPVIKPKEFALPWVDLDLKDGKDHHKGSRNKSKSGGHRSSISSLAEEDGKC